MSNNPFLWLLMIINIVSQAGDAPPLVTRLIQTTSESRLKEGCQEGTLFKSRLVGQASPRIYVRFSHLRDR